MGNAQSLISWVILDSVPLNTEDKLFPTDAIISLLIPWPKKKKKKSHNGKEKQGGQP